MHLSLSSNRKAVLRNNDVFTWDLPLERIRSFQRYFHLYNPEQKFKRGLEMLRPFISEDLLSKPFFEASCHITQKSEQALFRFHGDPIFCATLAYLYALRNKMRDAVFGFDLATKHAKESSANLFFDYTYPPTDDLLIPQQYYYLGIALIVQKLNLESLQNIYKKVTMQALLDLQSIGDTVTKVLFFRLWFDVISRWLEPESLAAFQSALRNFKAEDDLNELERPVVYAMLSNLAARAGLEDEIVEKYLSALSSFEEALSGQLSREESTLFKVKNFIDYLISDTLQCIGNQTNSLN